MYNKRDKRIVKAVKHLCNALGKFNDNTVFCSKGCDSCVFHQNKIDNMSLCDVMVELEVQLRNLPKEVLERGKHEEK